MTPSFMRFYMLVYPELMLMQQALALLQIRFIQYLVHFLMYRQHAFLHHAILRVHSLWVFHLILQK